MYALIRSGGKQYKVQKGDRLRVDLIRADAGASVSLDDVLAVHDGETLVLGAPRVDSAKVTAKVLGHGRDRKIVVFRFKRRKGYHRKKGHRQGYTEIEIQDIARG
ncbi:50S ribosomal protein L21 [Candidatus Sumerlaeota bacterium]|nr:50S ribosomal protein L21 [Candidatus Sumerlaeota bacterium]